MALSTNAELWRDARKAGGRGRKSLSKRIGTSRTVINAFAFESPRSRGFKGVSRIWIERHGRQAATVVSTLLRRPVDLDDLFPGWDRPDERPLTDQESHLLARAVEKKWGALSERERGVVQQTIGSLGQPMSLTEVALQMGVTRERIRQIEADAFRKMGIVLPAGSGRSLVDRRRRARVLLRMLTGR